MERIERQKKLEALKKLEDELAGLMCLKDPSPQPEPPKDNPNPNYHKSRECPHCKALELIAKFRAGFGEQAKDE